MALSHSRAKANKMIIIEYIHMWEAERLNFFDTTHLTEKK